ncbi:hypothetical protein [Agrobacterium vaccinii]|uniref:hypothetical protein n=1 Tax=Agrobacterium vaccinii TaxID=2735528 RepID=UPI001E4718C7|nr:hypothetical protein [Agrobacterium vaccinii]UHS56831.1 hypothetical protein HRS00_08460 [Agrobacterium vaccinii]
MSNSEFRYRIEMRAGSGGEWLNTGLAIKPRSGGACAVVVIADAPITDARHGVLHVSESNIFDPRQESLEEFSKRQSSGDLEALRKEVIDLKRQVITLTSKLRVEAVTNFAHVLRDIDRRGMA